mgnify:CR=1 FL=1
MSNSARQQSIWYKLHIDLPLLLGLLALMTLSMVVLYSASGMHVDMLIRQLLRTGMAFGLREVLEPERGDQVVIEVDAESGQDDGPLVLRLDPDDPAASWCVVRHGR